MSSILKLLSLESTSFAIGHPTWGYRTTWSDCDYFIRSLVQICTGRSEELDLGTIILSSVEIQERNMKFEVIDGQQCLMTVSLLLGAMYSLVRDGTLASRNESSVDWIFRSMLYAHSVDGSRRFLKLRPVRCDEKVYKNLVHGVMPKEGMASPLVVNFVFFRRELVSWSRLGIHLDDLLYALENVKVSVRQLNRTKQDIGLAFSQMHPEWEALA